MPTLTRSLRISVPALALPNATSKMNPKYVAIITAVNTRPMRHRRATSLRSSGSMTRVCPTRTLYSERVPELPDVTVYVERLRAFAIGQPIEGIRIASAFVLRTVTPAPKDLIGARVQTVERLGKRIVIGGEGDRYIVIHLMIAGRLRWKERGAALPRKLALAGFDFPNGTLVFTEASPKKRASLHVVAGRAALAEFDRGGLDVLTATAAEFADRLRSERHTVKRALTDPTLFDGIGNAYSDEILHAAKLSPFRITIAMTDAEIAALHRACIAQLTLWT